MKTYGYPHHTKIFKERAENSEVCQEDAAWPTLTFQVSFFLKTDLLKLNWLLTKSVTWSIKNWLERQKTDFFNFMTKKAYISSKIELLDP